MNLLSKSAAHRKRTRFKMPDKSFHSWIAIADWSGNCRCRERFLAKAQQKPADNFAGFVWRDFCDCFVNGVCYGDRQKKCRSLTSIMRTTVEFRFVEHCSWLLNPQLSKIILFFFWANFGQKGHKIGWIQIGSLSIVRAIRRVSTKLLF